MMRKSMVVVALACMTGTLALLAGSCTSVECAEGTAEKDGKCVAGGGVLCGEGTHLNQATMRCEPDLITCDPNTADVNDAGVCIGRITGTLPQPPACPTSVPDDEICVNGWLRDFDDKGQAPFSKDTLITDLSAEIWVFDPFQVLGCMAAPCFLTENAIAGPFLPNADGTYLLDKDVDGRAIKATGSFIALATRSAGGDANGAWAEAGITAPGQGGLIIENFDLYAVGKAQVEAWNTTFPGLVDAGVLVMMWHYLDEADADFAKNRTFIEGVLPNRAPAAIPLDQLYFMTDDRNTLAQGAADGVASTTAVGGSMLKAEPLSSHWATGGLIPGTQDPITWEEPRLGACVPGLVFLMFYNQKLQ